MENYIKVGLEGMDFESMGYLTGKEYEVALLGARLLTFGLCWLQRCKANSAPWSLFHGIQ